MHRNLGDCSQETNASVKGVSDLYNCGGVNDLRDVANDLI